MRRLELVEGKSSKFWEVDRAGATITVRFGRIGTAGQSQTRTHVSEAAATAELDRLVREKLRKGYSEKGGALAAPAVRASPPAPPPAAPEVTAAREPGPATSSDGWVDAGGGYELALVDGKLACRKGGKVLAAVPKAVKDGEVAEGLVMLREWLDEHRRACLDTVENWMLRSLPVPRRAVEAVWADAAWRRALENAFVLPLGAEAAGGFLRGTSARGIGLVDLDGETRWVDAEAVAIPHPVLLEGLDDARALATELSLEQGVKQLFRETFTSRAGIDPGALAVHAYADARFLQLNHCLSHCRKLGYRVKGGSAIVRVWERGEVFEARYWIGADDPMSEAWTGDLGWTGAGDAPLPVAALPPVAFSEGMRMAASIHAARHVEEERADG